MKLKGPRFDSFLHPPSGTSTRVRRIPEGMHYIPNPNGNNAVRRRLRQAALAELKQHVRNLRTQPIDETQPIVVGMDLGAGESVVVHGDR